MSLPVVRGPAGSTATPRVSNTSDASPSTSSPGSTAEVVPEPRTPWIDWGDTHQPFTGDLAGWKPWLVGNSFNHFQLWTLNQDGTEEETLNHIGRQELFAFVDRNRDDDFAVIDHVGFDPWVANQLELTSFHQVREDPAVPGAYYGIDCRELDTHASGQIVRLDGALGTNPNEMLVRYVTHRDTQAPTLSPGPNHSGFYRDPLPLSDGTLVAAHTANTRKESNLGTPSAPR